MTNSYSFLPHVIIFGTRTFRDFGLLKEKMNHYTSELGRVVVCTGEWRSIGYDTPEYVGADLLGERWAHTHPLRHPVQQFPPPFGDFPDSRAGRAGAFHARNREMVEYVAGLTKVDTAAVAFWDGDSSGTESVIELVKKHKILLKVVRY